MLTRQNSGAPAMSLRVLVTGASAGFGAAIARRLVADGHRVIAAARRQQRLAALAAELGDRLLPITLDVTDAAAVAALPASLPEAWRAVDVLVNNAGLGLGLSPAWQADLAQWDTMVATNVTGLIHMTRALLPGMVERDRGHVINISSTAAIYPYPGGHVYGASKAFVTQFSLNLRADLVGTGVRVTDLEPGLVGGSEFSQVRFGDAARAAAVYAGTTPLNPENIAEAVAWVLALPAHMNVNRMELMPTCQAPSALTIKRKT
jgi:3-hydroxy acid dehydrogenase/malonic semialdehyde reductase